MNRGPPLVRTMPGGGRGRWRGEENSGEKNNGRPLASTWLSGDAPSSVLVLSLPFIVRLRFHSAPSACYYVPFSLSLSLSFSLSLSHFSSLFVASQLQRDDSYLDSYRGSSRESTSFRSPRFPRDQLEGFFFFFFFFFNRRSRESSFAIFRDDFQSERRFRGKFCSGLRHLVISINAADREGTRLREGGREVSGEIYEKVNATRPLFAG